MLGKSILLKSVRLFPAQEKQKFPVDSSALLILISPLLWSAVYSFILVSLLITNAFCQTMRLVLRSDWVSGQEGHITSIHQPSSFDVDGNLTVIDVFLPFSQMSLFLTFHRVSYYIDLRFNQVQCIILSKVPTDMFNITQNIL